MNQDIRIAYLIPTYRRADGQTKKLLLRALNSIKNQTYKNIKVYLFGDKYDDIDEFNEFNIIEGMYMENLPTAPEREKFTGADLWMNGGRTAVNYGIRKIINDGYDWIAFLDHDDFLENTHVEDLVNIINKEERCVFVCSRTQYRNFLIPRISLPDDYFPYIPQPEDTAKSSTCMNLRLLDLLFREPKKGTDEEKLPGDIIMWRDLKESIQKNNYTSFCTGKVTCFCENDGYEKEKVNHYNTFNLKLVDCSNNYWEFVRLLRTHPRNQEGFFTVANITEEQQRNYMTENSHRYKVCLCNDIPVGYVGIIGTKEITYCVHPDFTSRGIGTFMVKEFTKDRNLTEAFVKTENISSQKVFEKLGWTKQIHYKYEK